MILEKELVRALNSGNKKRINKVFKEIYDTYFRLVFYVASLYVGESDAQDITADTFVSFFNSLDNFHSDGNIKYYLCSSCRNKALNFLKKKNHETEFNEDILPCEDEKYDHLELTSLLKKNLEKDEFELIILHVIEGVPLKEISSEKNIPFNTLKSRYHRALLKARKILEGK